MPGRPYAQQFKVEAIQLVRTSGKPVTQIAKDLGISPDTLYNWLKQDQIDSGVRSDGLTTAEREELRALRRENRILREEREILKKAAAYFAKETDRTR